MSKLFFSLIFLLNSIISLSQAIRIEGVLINESDSTRLVNIHVFSSNKRIATVSDEYGNFSINLPAEYKDSYLFFTGIGYKKDSLLIASQHKEYIISLAPEIYTLQEIYVIPDSTLLTLLRKAYYKIPENYPVTPTLYEGFYRESSQNDDKEQADFIEAHLSIYKDPYDNPSGDPGKVELLKSRKRKIRNAGILYYGGPFLPVNTDVVLRRENYINPRHFRKYSYEFNGIKALGNQEFYEISFSTATKDTTSINGVMLIEKESLAYVSFDLRSNMSFSHPRISKRTSHSKIKYEKIGNKWYYKSYTSEKEDFFRFSDKKIYKKTDYVTTHIQTDSAKPIPYDRQLAFLDPFVLKAEEYNPQGWTDYNLLQNSGETVNNFQFSLTESEEIFNRKQSSLEKKTKRLHGIASIFNRTNAEIGLLYNPVTLDDTHHDIRFQPDPDLIPFQIDQHQTKETQYPLIYSSIGYRLSKSFHVVYENTDDWFNKNISSTGHRLGVTYRKNLTNTGRIFFVEGSLMGTSRGNYVKLGKYGNHSAFRIGGKKIDASKISFWYGNQQQMITPQIALKRNVSRLFYLKLFLAYNIELSQKDVFRIKEEKGALFSKKTATIRANDPTLSFENEDKKPWSSLTVPKWQAGIALTFN